MSVKPLPAPGRANGPLSNRLIFSAAVSAVGDGFTIVALGLLTLTLTRDPRMVALVFAAERLPWLIGLPLARAVDRARRPVVVLIGADLARAVVLAAAAAAVRAGWATVPVVALVGFLLGVGTVVHGAGRSVVLAHLDDGPRLARTNGYLSSVEGLGYAVIGPALGALVFAWGTALPLALDAVTFVASAASLRAFAGLRAQPVPPDAPAPPGVVRAVLRDRLLAPLLAVTVCLGLAEAITWSMMPLFVRGDLGVSTAYYGAFLAVAALGGVATGFATPHLWATRRGTTLLALGAVMTSGFAHIALSGEYTVLVALGLFVVTNAAIGVTNTILPTLRLEHAPPAARGRTATFFRQAVVGVQPIGAALAALVAQHHGTRTAVLVAGLILVVGASAAAVPLHRAIGARATTIPNR